jgi:hypothetical protein
MNEGPRELLRRHGKWLLIPASGVLGLLFVELAVRLLRLAPPVHAIWVADDESFYRRATNPMLNYELKPGFHRRLPAGSTTVNSHGLRDLPRSEEKPAGRHRILLLGDSVIEGINYVDDENTISRQLQSLYPDGQTEVLNFGTSGYCTLAEVNLFREKGLAFQPDVVVLFFVWNDYQNFNPDHTVAGGVIDRPVWSKHGFVNFHLFRHLALRFNWFEFAAELNPIGRHRDAIGEANVIDGLALLRNLANEHGFQVLILPWPHFGDDRIDYLPAGSGETLLIERLAVMNGLPVTRLADPLREVWQTTAPSANPRTRFTIAGDGMHPNPTCAQLVAPILKSLIKAPRSTPPYSPGPADPGALAAARTLSRGYQKGPEMPPPLDQRHYHSLMHQARREEAVAHLQTILKRQPRDQFANHVLATHMIRLGDLSAAARLLRVVLKENVGNVNARIMLANVLDSEQKFRKAAELLQAGLREQPMNASLHLSLGALCLTNAEFGRAEKHLTAARKIAPDKPELTPLLRQLETERSGR